jgi:energy-converting hydrogenase Eha subunit A
MTLFGLDIWVYIMNLVIALPTFFMLRLILKKIIITDRLLRNALTWTGTIILTPLIYVGLIAVFIAYVSYYPTRNFNEETWRSDNGKRYEMTEDLIKSEILIGKTKDEVKKILGDNFYKYDENHWAYDIGFVPGLSNIDPEVLDVYFKDGIVKRIGQHET